MATKISASAAREAARKKLLSRYETALDALAEFEQLNYQSQMDQFKQARDKAVEKAEAKYTAEVEKLRAEVAPVVVHLRETLSMSEVAEHTGFNRTEQKEFVELAQGERNSDDDSQRSDGDENDQNHSHEYGDDHHHFTSD